MTARLIASWKIPSQAAPSPKKTAVIAPASPCPIFCASATPGASESSPPTIVEVRMTPSSATEMWSVPLLPLQIAVDAAHHLGDQAAALGAARDQVAGAAVVGEDAVARLDARTTPTAEASWPTDVQVPGEVGVARAASASSQARIRAWLRASRRDAWRGCSSRDFLRDGGAAGAAGCDGRHSRERSRPRMRRKSQSPGVDGPSSALDGPTRRPWPDSSRSIPPSRGAVKSSATGRPCLWRRERFVAPTSPERRHMRQLHRMASTLAAAACVASALFGCGGNDDPAVAPVTITVVGPNAVSQWNEIATTTINQPAQATGTPEERLPHGGGSGHPARRDLRRRRRHHRHPPALRHHPHGQRRRGVAGSRRRGGRLRRPVRPVRAGQRSTRRRTTQPSPPSPPARQRRRAWRSAPKWRPASWRCAPTTVARSRSRRSFPAPRPGSSAVSTRWGGRTCSSSRSR